MFGRAAFPEDDITARSPRTHHLLLLPIVAGIILAAAIPLRAHTELESSNPEDGSQVNQMPAVVTLRFTDVVIEPIALAVVGPDGRDLVSGAPEIVDNAVTQPLSPEENPGSGTYSISYQVSAADGHPLTGELTFDLVVSETEGPTTTTPTTTTPPTTTPPTTTSPSTATATTRPATAPADTTTTQAVTPPTSQDVGATEADDEGVTPITVALVSGLGVASLGLATFVLMRILNREGDGED